MKTHMNTLPTAVITGAGGTICSVMALELARKGHPVALLGRTLSKLEKVASQIRNEGGTALCIAIDVTDITAVRQAGEQVFQELGPCRILINGAGGKLPGGVMSQTEYSPEELKEDSQALGFLNCDLEVFRSEVDLNLSGTAIPSQVFGRQMAQAGGGNIVNFASMTSFRPLSKVPAYAAAKAAIVNYTQWLAAYLAPARIRVNAIAPGFIVNERSRKLLFNEDQSPSPRGTQVLNHTPMKRFGEADELIGTLNWLTDDACSGFVTGITVPVDGGFLSCPGT